MDNLQNNSLNAPETAPAAPSVPPMPTAGQTPFVPSVPPYCAKPKKEKVQITFGKKDKIFMCLFILSAAFIVFLGLFGGFSIGLTLGVWVLTGVTAVYLKDNGDFSLLSVSALLSTLVSSAAFALYGDGGVTCLLAAFMTVISYITFAVSLCDDSVFDDLKGVLKLVFSSVVSPLVNIAVPVKAAVGEDKAKRKNAVQIIAAITISIPVLCVIIPLLVESDAAFQGLVHRLAEDLGLTVVKIIITAVIAALLLSFAVTNRYDIFGVELGTGVKAQKPLKSAFTVTLLSALSVVYIVFLFSQLAYFVSSFKGLLPEGFTFADYARRGFFETESVAFINLGITVLLMYLTARNEKDELPLPVKALMSFVSAFSIFFIATAVAKMIMYINTYGLTRLRIFTFVFMLSTCAFIIAFLVRVFKLNAKTVKYAVAFTLAAFSVLSAVGLERTIASYNVNAYLTGKHSKVDMAYLYELGDCAMPYIGKLTGSKDEKTAKTAKEAVSYFFREMTIDENYISIDGKAVKELRKDFNFNVNSYKLSKMYDELQLEYYRDVICSENPFWNYGYDYTDTEVEWYG